MINANNGDVNCGKYRISVTITTEYDDPIFQPLVRRLKESLKSEKQFSYLTSMKGVCNNTDIWPYPLKRLYKIARLSAFLERINQLQTCSS